MLVLQKTQGVYTVRTQQSIMVVETGFIILHYRRVTICIVRGRKFPVHTAPASATRHGCARELLLGLYYRIIATLRYPGHKSSTPPSPNDG